MKSRTLLLALLLALLANGGGAQADDAAVQDLVFFGQLRPVTLRLHLYVDGKPFREVWRDHARMRLQQIDADGDGRISVDEANQAWPSLAAISAAGQAKPGDAALARFAGTQPGAVATIDACLDWQENTIDGPFSISESAAAALSDGALMKLIDRDQDGRLARDEIATAPDVLRRRDFDNNEVLTRSELISGEALYESVAPGETPPAASDSAASDSAASENAASATDDERTRIMFVISRGATPSELAQAMLRRYDRQGDGVLCLNVAGREIAFPSEVAAQLDANGDARLDVVELERLAELGPNVELAFQLGRLSSEVPHVASPLPAADKPPAADAIRIRERSDGSYQLKLADAQVDLRRDNRHPTKNRPQDFRFRNFDRDTNGYLDQNEARPILGKAPLALLDTDGNDQVSEKEFEAFLTREGDAAGARLVLALTGEGQNLFEQIDANLDGGLTPRELRTASDQLAGLDQNADGFLDGDELPQQVALVLARGRLRLPSATDAAAMRRPRGAVRVEEEAGPNWFRKMDRNRDGDVSPREFLGKPELFQKLDADGDGLLDAAEAEAAAAKS